MDEKKELKEAAKVLRGIHMAARGKALSVVSLALCMAIDDLLTQVPKEHMHHALKMIIGALKKHTPHFEIEVEAVPDENQELEEATPTKKDIGDFH